MDDRKINESSPEFLLRMLGRLDEDGAQNTYGPKMNENRLH